MTIRFPWLPGPAVIVIAPPAVIAIGSCGGNAPVAGSAGGCSVVIEIGPGEVSVTPSPAVAVEPVSMSAPPEAKVTDPAA